MTYESPGVVRQGHGRPRQQRKTNNDTPWLIRIATVALLWPALGQAAPVFNPAFLAGDSGAVADLTPIEQGAVIPPGRYRVMVYVNQHYLASYDLTFAPLSTLRRDEPRYLPLLMDAGDMDVCLPASVVGQFGLREDVWPAAGMSATPCVPLKQYVPEAGGSFEAGHQRLDITLPQASLAHRPRGYVSPQEWDDGINAAMVSYSFNGAHQRGDYRYDDYFLTLQNRINVGALRFHDDMTWRHGRSGSQWTHIKTFMEMPLPAWESDLVVGESFSPADVFDGLGFKGIQLASDDSALPDSRRGYAPTVRGIARSNARVTVRQNGYVVYESSVAPGPFEITDLYPASSSGDLTVSVQENDGETHSFIIPYSAVPILQRQGRIKYAVTAGRFRGNTDQSSPTFGQASLIYGLPHGMTVFGGGQYADRYRALALGWGQNMGEFGAFSVSGTQAHSELVDGSEHSGQSWSFLYSKSLNELGTTFQLLGYRYSSKGFYTLDQTANRHMSGGVVLDDEQRRERDPAWVADALDYYNLHHSRRSRVQLSISQRIPGAGTLFISGSEEAYWHMERKNRLWQAGYSDSVGSLNYSLAFSDSRSAWNARDNQLYTVSLSYPIGRLGGRPGDSSPWLSWTTTRDDDGRMNHSAILSGTALADNNLGYSVRQSYANQGNGYNGGVSLDYHGALAESQLGYSYDRDSRQISYVLRGSAVAHRDGLTLGRQLGDANILVKAPGAQHVKIEGNSGLATDSRGYAIVPYASLYRRNRVALDINTLHNNVELTDAVTHVVPTRGALVRAEFDVHTGMRSLITLRQPGGQPVPFGATVTLLPRRSDPRTVSEGIVDDHSQAYMAGLPLRGRLLVRWGDAEAQQCHIDYLLTESVLEDPLTYITSECAP
ncbi:MULTISPECIES: fimbria/pilus outer membrane usher protein [unclassified Zymobacter]|uniref:fimbria/pilus outer membrane usher protein n=1 Tax=unclassified Zymobacter TaxID=3048685 RepID=UPI0039C0A031